MGFEYAVVDERHGGHPWMDPRGGKMIRHQKHVGCGCGEQPRPARLGGGRDDRYGEVNQAYGRAPCQPLNVEAAGPGRVADDDQFDVVVGQPFYQLEGVPTDTVIAVLHHSAVDRYPDPLSALPAASISGAKVRFSNALPRSDLLPAR
jgi:hypothetical protein